jgi:hypothetical protein
MQFEHIILDSEPVHVAPLFFFPSLGGLSLISTTATLAQMNGLQQKH